MVFRDVTEERRAEEAIAEQREWFETTLKSMGMGSLPQTRRAALPS